jgi:hypothetical protein
VNRLEFIRRRVQPGPGSSGTPAANQIARTAPEARTASVPRAGSTYTYATDAGPGRSPPAPTPAAAPKPPAAPTAQVNYVPPAATPAAALRSSGPGLLRKAYQTDQGRTLYYLQGSDGGLRCYVAPTAGVDLEPFVGQLVEVRGNSLVYRMDLRGNYLPATQVVPLNRP